MGHNRQPCKTVTWQDRSSRPSWWNGQLCESKNLVRKEAPHHTTSTEEVIRLHREKLRKEDEQPALLLPSIYVAHFFFFSIVLDDRKRTKTILIELKKKKKKSIPERCRSFFFPRENVAIRERRHCGPQKWHGSVTSLLFLFSLAWLCMWRKKTTTATHRIWASTLLLHNHGKWAMNRVVVVVHIIPKFGFPWHDAHSSTWIQ